MLHSSKAGASKTTNGGSVDISGGESLLYSSHKDFNGGNGECLSGSTK